MRCRHEKAPRGGNSVPGGFSNVRVLLLDEAFEYLGARLVKGDHVRALA